VKSLMLTVAVGSMLLLFNGPAQADEKNSMVLDGEPKSLVIVGYSTSFIWPHMLQYMLDIHAGKEGVYHVINSAVGGSSVPLWLEGSNRYERTYGKMIREYLGHEPERLGDRPRPTIALCQQSLQFLYEKRNEGIEGADDLQRISKGADAFQKLAEQLHLDGVRSIFIASHIYKVTMEPAIENEKFALQALMERNISFVLKGPELWEPTKAIFPEGFSLIDKVHPSMIGARVMAEGWYRAVAGKAAKEEVVEAMRVFAFPELVEQEEKRETNREEQQKRRREGRQGTQRG